MNSNSSQSQGIISSVARTSQRLSSPIPFIPQIIQEELNNCSFNDFESEDGNRDEDSDFGLGSDDMKVKYGFRDGTPSSIRTSEGNETTIIVPTASNSIDNYVNESHDPLLRPRAVKDSDLPAKKKSRNPTHWKKNVIKTLREQGEEYVNAAGRKFPKKLLQQTICCNECTFNCCVNFSESVRESIHEEFWKLTDDLKRCYYSKFVKKTKTARKRTSSTTSRRQYTYKYYFENFGQRFRVCKIFFFATLNISQNRIYYFFKSNDNNNGSPKPTRKGKTNSRIIDPEKLKKVRQHIESFPCIDSHYVRRDTQKQYLESNLDVCKMYQLYKSEISSDLVTIYTYRKIFNTEYNLSFYKPKKDLCDICTRFNNNKDQTDIDKKKYMDHKQLNEKAKLRRQADRELRDPNVAVISYDLQSVFTLPYSNVSNFYYKRKLNMYNLTGLCNLNKITYCSVWYESQSGRSGNDIASALIKILKAVMVDNPDITGFIIWSDSCIPQNRNRITSLAILKFLEENHQLKSIEQRFSVPGHSRIQELDAVHSVIDRHLKHIFYYSPLSLIRELKAMNYANVSLKIMQCTAKDFFNYSAATNGLNFIPYSKAREIIYDDSLHLKFRESYGEESTKFSVSVLPPQKTKNRSNKSGKIIRNLPNVQNTSKVLNLLSKEKKNDIESMLPWMPLCDVEFYKTILNQRT